MPKRTQTGRVFFRGIARAAPVLRSLKDLGHDPLAFRRRGLWAWPAIGLLVLLVLALFPLDMPETGVWVLRIDYLLALTFLLSAVGLWLGMGGRAFAVGAVLAVALYAIGAASAGISAGLGYTTAVEDLQSLAVLVAFLVFALAGFNLVFVLEETVHDAHRVLHPRGPLLARLIVAACLAIALAAPVWHAHGGPALPALQVTATTGFAVLGALAVGRLLRLRGAANDVVLRELHLFVVGALAAAGLLDCVGLLRAAEGLLPSLVAYGSLLGTWVYVTYTTLQRTHFLLRGDDPRPWLAILAGASFAILAHTQSLYEYEGGLAVQDLLTRRITFLAVGVGLGIALYLLRGAWAALIWVRGRVGDKPTGIAGNATNVAAGVAAGLLSTEDKVERAAYAIFRGIDTVLPGTHHPPTRPVLAWQRELGIDPDANAVTGDVHDVEQMPEGAD